MLFQFIAELKKECKMPKVTIQKREKIYQYKFGIAKRFQNLFILKIKYDKIQFKER